MAQQLNAINMDRIGEIILGLYALAALVIIVLLIYLIDRRIKIKRKENFEDRDN
jgi:hypothetical protein